MPGCGQAASRQGERDVILPHANQGLTGEEGDSLGVLLGEILSDVGGRLLQAGFVALLPLCFSLFTCRRELPGPCSSPPEHTGVANGETCSLLISAQCLSPAAGLGGKPLPFCILLPSVARGVTLGRVGGGAWGAKLWQQTYAMMGACGSASQGCPCPALGTPQSVRWPCLCVPVDRWSCADEVCEGRLESGSTHLLAMLVSRCCAEVMVLVPPQLRG